MTRRLVTVVLVLGLPAGAGCADRAVRGSDPPPTVQSSPPRDEPSTKDGEDAPSLAELDLRLFVRGELLRLGTHRDDSVGMVPGSSAQLGPPADTPHGVLVEIGSSGDPFEIWLMRTDGTAELLAENTQGLAPSAEGTRFAYAEIRPEGQGTYGSSTIVLTTLPDGRRVASSGPIGGYARAEGFVGDDILVTTGDGATAGVAVWDPDAAVLSPAEGFRDVLATDPERKLALLAQGDGPCWSAVVVDQAQIAPVGASGCDGLGAAQFSPDGQLIAGIATDGDRSSLRVYRLSEADPILDRAVEGAFQTLWAADGGVLVLAAGPGRSHSIRHCGVDGRCEALWSRPTDGSDHGEVWLVSGA